MITGGNATVCVSDMDRAVTFYVNLLGFSPPNHPLRPPAGVRCRAGFTGDMRPPRPRRSVGRST